MNFVQQLEECLRDLASEARKKHPGVKEASERATLKLRSLQNAYIQAIRQANKIQPQQQQNQQQQSREEQEKSEKQSNETAVERQQQDNTAKQKYPTTRLFQSSELLHPFLLAANYPNASDRLLEVSFRAMRLLMDSDAIVPSDGIHMVRVWMIQAQVVAVGYYGRIHANHQQQQHPTTSPNPPNSGNNSKGKISKENSKQEDEGAAAATTTSSWFGWGSSSSTSATTSTNAASSSNHASSPPDTTASSSSFVKSAISSSGHQSGIMASQVSSSSPAQMERRAKEILSCLLQLLDSQQTHYAEQGHPTRELWTNAVALGCIWFQAVPAKHTVHQAARSTLLQVVNGLYNGQQQHAATNNNRADFCHDTWHDLLALATLSSTPQNNEPSSKRLQSLKGAFALCKKTLRASSSAAGLSCPPSAGFCLELMTNVWKEETSHSQGRQVYIINNSALLQRTKSITLGLLQDIPKAHTPVETTLRTLQWTLAFLSYNNKEFEDDTAECTELIGQFSKPIALATEACRTQHEFEDGFIYQSSFSNYSGAGSSSGGGMQDAANTPTNASSSNTTMMMLPNEPLTTFFPTVLLWKAGLALEATHLILERHATTILSSTTTSTSCTTTTTSLLANLAESLSDFATIGASCRDHMLQLAEYAVLQREEGIISSPLDGSSSHRNTTSSSSGGAHKSYTFFRRAEQAVASGNHAIFTKSYLHHPQDGGGSGGGGSTSSANSSDRGTRLMLGEALWIALQGILRIEEYMNHMMMKQQDNTATLRVLEETFAPSLAVLQHYLKRFVGSKDLIQLALQGYASLSNVACLQGGTSLQRKAILTSLCKLSLPSWGKRDASCQLLQDHHVRCLLCLFRIVHTHYNAVSLEWDMILWTLEELSVLAIASPLLSDETYHAALAVAAALERFPAFSTCFSEESLLRLVEALSDIAKAAMVDRDVVGDSDTVVDVAGPLLSNKSAAAAASDNVSSENNTVDGKETTISEKIMNIGVRAIYGSGGTETDKSEDALIMERTKNTFYEDYRSDFVKRLASTKSTVRVTAVGKMPLSLAFLTDVIMANSFRWRECGDEFSKLLSGLAVAAPAVRPFAMDVISMLTMSYVSKDRALPVPFVGPGKLVFADPMQSQMWAVEPLKMGEEDETSGGGRDEKSQSELLAPTCQTLRTTEKADVAESALGALFSILEGVGHQLSGEDVWSIVIDAVSSLSGDPSYDLDRSSAEWSSCCLMAFRCLKFIVDDFLDQISSSTESAAATRTSLLDCCSSFGRSRHDVNTSLTAIGLLWTIADQDSGADSIDRALSKLVLLASDSRPEVRNAAVNTLFSCIVGKGGSFSPERWEMCFSESIFGVYDLVLTRATEDENEPVSETEKQSQRYNMSLHHSRDSNIKQWVTTQVLVLRGLLRVLRIYFSQLLDTTDTSEIEDVPWFQDAWVRILDWAFEAASLSSGGRDNLDIRAAGVEMLVVCCQLTSKAGIQAGATPARVGTNMEVVNGALRSVRESQGSKSSYERSHSKVTELSRLSLFLEAFEGLESYKDFIEKTIEENAEIDESMLQVLHKFGTGLAQLYECCKENELTPNDPSRDLRSFESVQPNSEPQAEEEDLELRFVRNVTTVLVASTVDAKSRFLNQGQRCALTLLQSMASNGSMEAFKQLVSIAGSSFFVKQGTDTDESESSAVAEDHPPGPDLVGAEASRIVSEEIAKDSVRGACKAMVLYMVLVAFSNEYGDDVTRKSSSRRRFYKLIIPIVTFGLEAVSGLDGDRNIMDKARELVWTNLFSVLSNMLAPVPVGKDMLKISRVSDLLEILAAARDNVPSSYRSELSTLLSFGASNSFEVAKQHVVFATGHSSNSDELGKKSKRHRDDLLKLFNLCFSAACSLQPEDALLRSISRQAFNDALMEQKDNSSSEAEKSEEGAERDKLAFRDEVAVSVCRTIEQSEKMEALVVSVFSLLCKLVTSDKAALRDAAGRVLLEVDVAELLEKGQSRYEEAERRAEIAEKRVKELSQALDELHRKNESLSREVAG